MALVWNESPAPERSDIGVPGAMAAGSGRPSCFARSTIASVRVPPADEPKIAMWGEDYWPERTLLAPAQSWAGQGGVNMSKFAGVLAGVLVPAFLVALPATAQDKAAKAEKGKPVMTALAEDAKVK